MPGWFDFFFVSGFRFVFPITLYFLFIWGASLFAYRRNARLPVDSPKKRDYHPYAVVIAPFTLPIIFVIGISLRILLILVRSILFGMLLILLPLVLIFFRNLRLIRRILKKFEQFGRALLKINTYLLRLAGFPPPHPA